MAIFEASAGTVALGANVQARALQFSISTGCLIDGGAFSIQMNQLPSGASPLVGVNAGITATINAAIAGTTGLNKAGTGTLILGGTNIYSGTTTMDGGILLVNGSLTSSYVPSSTAAPRLVDWVRFSVRSRLIPAAPSRLAIRPVRSPSDPSISCQGRS